jgi:DNA replication protein DnaD
MDTVPYRPLGILKTILESLGFEVTHCYEDLVFVEHNAFLLRMEEKGEEVSLLFNTESDEDKRDEIAELIKTEAAKHHIVISCPGTYQMTPNEIDGTIKLEFQEH